MTTEPDYEAFARLHHGGQPYSNASSYYDGHLQKVIDVLVNFGYRDYSWRASGALHDVVEDCMPELTPLERADVIRDTFGDIVGDRVWAVSGFGLNRRARNADIYAKLRVYPQARILKCADRIVNVETSVRDRSAYGSMYLKEAGGFAATVKPGVPKAMWQRLENAYVALREVTASRAFRAA